LRRLSLKYPPRLKVLNAAKTEYYIKSKKGTDVKRVSFQCNICKKKGFKSKEIQVDHIIPIINPNTGFTNFGDYIERLLCDESNFQVVCSSCHDIKTRNEDLLRK
jgi:5-methylcytosine-specific restriction endonuclease McrA